MSLNFVDDRADSCMQRHTTQKCRMQSWYQNFENIIGKDYDLNIIFYLQVVLNVAIDNIATRGSKNCGTFQPSNTSTANENFQEHI